MMVGLNADHRIFSFKKTGFHELIHIARPGVGGMFMWIFNFDPVNKLALLIGFNDHGIARVRGSVNDHLVDKRPLAFIPFRQGPFIRLRLQQRLTHRREKQQYTQHNIPPAASPRGSTIHHRNPRFKKRFVELRTSEVINEAEMLRIGEGFHSYGVA